jgi:hypothetical protein
MLFAGHCQLHACLPTVRPASALSVQKLSLHTLAHCKNRKYVLVHTVLNDELFARWETPISTWLCFTERVKLSNGLRGCRDN